MLTSTLGIRVILWMGPTVPLPAPVAVSSALTRIEVTNDADQGDGFQLSFTMGKDSVVEYGLLRAGAIQPFSRIIIGVVFGVLPEVLIDGVVTHHQVAPSNEPGQSVLTITGKDVSLMMDLEEKNAQYPNLPDFLIFTKIVAGYAQYGLVPLPTPTADLPIMLLRIPRQHETDFRFLQRLARRNGYVFYIEPITFGVSQAYFGPENRLSLPQPALSQNLGPATNLKSLSFSHDALAPFSTEGTVVEPITKTALPVPSLPSLRVPPLAAEPTTARRKVLLRQTAGQSPITAATSAVAAVSRSPDAISGQGELDAVRYGHALRARKLVGVRGAGLSYDGFYYVRRVTHVIERGSYTQRFTVSREGTTTLLPAVIP